MPVRMEIRGTVPAEKNPTLSGLSLGTGVALNPVFESGTTAYTASVRNAVAELTVTPTKAAASATIDYLDESDVTLADADDMEDGFQVALPVGNTVIKVKVTSEDRTATQTYTVTVNRSVGLPGTCTLNDGDEWCGVVTVAEAKFAAGSFEFTEGHGFTDDDFRAGDAGTLSDTTFTLVSTEYTITRILIGAGGAGSVEGTLSFGLAGSGGLPAADVANLELHVGDNSFAFSDAAYVDATGANLYAWADSGLTWSVDDTVTLRLRRTADGGPPTNNVPVFPATTATLTVPENSPAGTNVGDPVTATDDDTGDTLEYSLEGTDATSFAVDSASGQITTIANVDYNHEATKNSYSVTVKASDGTDSATIAVTINVTDVQEKPLKPAAPTVSAASATSLSVTWTAPANAGPAITDYDHRHRTTSPQGTSPQGTWTEVTDTTITGLSATIGSLAEDTSYDVQVRATNAEGTGDWSASGTGSTDANAAPAFDSSATLTPDENQTTAGTVVATDDDAGDDVTDYAITGGADRGAFSIHSTSGALTFDAAPNYEDPDDADTDGSYQVEVQATSGAGEREKTATQAITVTVADVNERSAKPAKPTLAAVEGSTTSLAASWTKPDLDGGPDITDYDVRFREGTSGGWTEVTHDGDGRIGTLAGLEADTAYQAQVRADNGERESDWSDPSDAVRTNAEEATAPDAPRDVTATADGETRIDLDWRAPAPDGGSAVTGYRIEVSDDGGSFFVPFETTGAAVTAYAHTGLSAGATRHYRVYAVNAEGESPPSSVVGATTDEEREPEGNEPSVIRAYWIGSGGGNDKSGCAGTEQFRAYWNPPLESNRGNNRTYKVADAWEADITLSGSAGDLDYTIQDTGGNPEHPELTGSVRIDGNGWLSMRVRGRFGADGWGGWSPTSSLYCRAASARVDGPLLALTWPTPRDGFAAPAGGDFAVRADGAPVTVTDAALVGRHALLTLGAPVLAGQSVSVDYLGSATIPEPGLFRIGFRQTAKLI